MKCADCGQDILQENPAMCPYCRSKNLISEEDENKARKEIDKLAKAGRYEEAALRYEKIDLWDQAKECRQLAKRKHVGSAKAEMGKVATVTLSCPHCSATQSFAGKSAEAVCSRCGTTYKIPKNVLALMQFEESN
jgi:DNA-directed RNA polymerase subunit RPC12/RpoP